MKPKQVISFTSPAHINRQVYSLGRNVVRFLKLEHAKSETNLKKSNLPSKRTSLPNKLNANMVNDGIFVNVISPTKKQPCIQSYKADTRHSRRIKSDSHLSITKANKNRMSVPIRPRTTKVPKKILFEHKSDKIMSKKRIRHFMDGYVTQSYRHGNQIRLTYAEMQPLLLNTKSNELQISQKRTKRSSISQHKKEIEDDYKEEAATKKGFFKRMCRRFQKLICWNKN